MRRLLLLVAVACSGAACAPAADVVAGDEAPLTLNPGQCRAPTTGTAPHLDGSGAPIPGTARTTLNGCVLAQGAATGADLLARATLLLEDASKLATVTDTSGAPLFKRLTAVAPTGDLATGLTSDLDIQLGWNGAPTGHLRLTLRQLAADTLTFSLVNPSALVSSETTAVDAGALAVNARLRAESNGISVAATSDVTLLQHPEDATQASMIVRHLFTWIGGELGH